MGKVTDFLRKIGLMQVSSGDAVTGEFDSREDLKEQPQQEPAPQEPIQEQAPEMTQEEPAKKEEL